MNDELLLEEPFETRPPRLKHLVNKHLMGDVWIRDTPFGPVTDSLVLAKKFEIAHKSVLRAIDKCRLELSTQHKFVLRKQLIENTQLAGPKGRQTQRRKVDITEFGLALLLLYINTPKARQISAEIIYRFFIMKSYISGLNENQLGALKGYYLKRMRENIKENK